MPPAPDNNEAGFWESRELARLHDELLACAGSAWDDWREFNPDWSRSPVAAAFKDRLIGLLSRDFADSALFVLKDPRICRFVPFWLDVLSEFGAVPACVLPIRNPIEVAGSLKARDRFAPAKSKLLWLRHVLDAEVSTRKLPRVVVSYDQLLEDWYQVADALGERLSLAWPINPLTAQAEIDRFLQARHRHHRTGESALLAHPQIGAWLKTAYAAMSELARGGDPGPALARLDSVRSELNRACEAFGPLFRAEEMAREEERALAARESGQRQEAFATQEGQLEAAAEHMEAEAAASRSRIQHLEEELRERDARIHASDLVLAAERARLQRATSERDTLAGRLGHLQSSASWRLTLPLRWMEARWPGTMRALALAPQVAWWTITLQLANRLRMMKTERLLMQHGLFDAAWYAQEYPDVVAAGLSPLGHWLSVGWKEGRNPHPLFDTSWYMGRYPDVARAGVNPLVHYMEHGAREGRDPCPLFDTSWYLGLYPDVRQSSRNPLTHYLVQGAGEGRDPHPLFRTAWYLAENEDVARSGINPLMHYLCHGGWEGRDPNPLFQSAWYLEHNPQAAAAHINPLVHYLQHGTDGGVDPGPDFDAQAYLRLHPDAASAGMNPLEHCFRSLDAESPPVATPERTDPGAGGETPRTGVYRQVYEGYLLGSQREPASDDYVPDTATPFASADSAIRAIAFYLPQFHPIPENDAWWGKGFTEWINVSKATPQFVGHFQPHLPGELGFYDLRLPEVQRRQAELARRYGIHGFCYHYYWFAGRRLLEGPLDRMLADPEITLPFCICWANENWTRRWDGRERDILMAQEHSPRSDLAFIEEVAPLFADPRYIRIHGRPLLIVYRVNLLPDPVQTAERWRLRCRGLGLPEPYLVAAQPFGITDPRPFGFDAAVEFPPHGPGGSEITDEVTLLNPNFAGQVYSYRVFLERAAGAGGEPYTRFRCASPSWDNEARAPGHGLVFAGASPRLYGEWLDMICRDAAGRTEADERMIFINAWNEWAEGAHLEPDRRYGYAHLRVTGETLRRFPATASPHDPALAWIDEEPRVRKARIAVIAHLYYAELWDELAGHLDHMPEAFDLFVTLSREEDAELIRRNRPAQAAQCFLARAENRGRDIAPFLSVLPIVRDLGYELGCKVHSKGKSTHGDGDRWRRDMLEKLLGSRDVIADVTAFMRSDATVGLVAPTGHLLPAESFWGGAPTGHQNRSDFVELTYRVGLAHPTGGFWFPAGSMYWFRVAAAEPLARIGLKASDFEDEIGQQDGTLAHAVERLVGLACGSDGLRVAVTKDARGAEPPTPWIRTGTYPFACATRDGRNIQEPIEGIR